MEPSSESSPTSEPKNESNTSKEEVPRSSQDENPAKENSQHEDVTQEIPGEHEKQSETTQKDAEQKESEAPKEGGWGSWGNWWSTATSVVSQATSIVNKSVEEYVKPTVASISQTTSHMVHELVDDDEEDKKETETEETNQNEAQPAEGKDFFTVVDKSFTYIGDSVDYLGNYINEGIQKVASNVRTGELQSKAAGFATTSITKAKQVAVSTTEKGLHLGEQLAVQSVDALEAVGKTALGYLTVSESQPDSEKKRIRPIFYHPRLTAEEEQKFEETLNRDYFDESHGTAHLQALENLSIECTLKMQKVEPKLSEKQREELNVLILKIKELFTEAEDDESSPPPMELPEIKLNEPATQHQNTLDILTKEAHDRALEFSRKYKEEIKELNPSSSGESIITSVDICHLTASYLDKIVLESVQTLSKLSSASVEQVQIHVENHPDFILKLLKTLESFLIDVDMSDTKLSAEETIKKATFVFVLSQLLIEELTSVSNDFVDCVKGIADEGNATFAILGAKGDQEATESKQCTEDITTKMNLHMNHIYLDSSNAISNIQDCKKFLFPICKSLLLDTIDKSPKEPKNEDKQEEQTSSQGETNETVAENTSN